MAKSRHGQRQLGSKSHALQYAAETSQIQNYTPNFLLLLVLLQPPSFPPQQMGPPPFHLLTPKALLFPLTTCSQSTFSLSVNPACCISEHTYANLTTTLPCHSPCPSPNHCLLPPGHCGSFLIFPLSPCPLPLFSHSSQNKSIKIGQITWLGPKHFRTFLSHSKTKLTFLAVTCTALFSVAMCSFSGIPSIFLHFAHSAPTILTFAILQTH